MASKGTPRKRSVRVEVANPRRSTRLTPASINGVHPVTPHHDTFVHTDFEVESGSQAAAYRYAMEDSELDNLPTTSSAISSASPAVGRRKTPQRKKAAATAPTSSARRSSNRHKPVSGLDLSDEDTETIPLMSDSLTSAHSHSDSSTAGQHQDDTTTDDDYNDRPSSSLLTPAPSGRRRSEATSPALSPIVEESPAHQHGQRRTGADVLDKDNGMHTASLGDRLASFLAHLWWLAGSRAYLFASAILCWDVWLIVSVQHVMNLCLAPFRGILPVSKQASRQSASRQFSPLATVGVLLLVAMLIFLLGSAIQPQSAGPAARTERAKTIISSLNTGNLSAADLRKLIAQEVTAEVERSLPQHLDGHSQKVQSQLKANSEKLSSDIEAAVLRILTQPSTTAHKHWDKRLTSAIDEQKSAVSGAIRESVEKDQAAADLKFRELLKSRLEAMKADVTSRLTQLNAGSASQHQATEKRLQDLSAKQSDMEADVAQSVRSQQLTDLETRLLKEVGKVTARQEGGSAVSSDVHKDVVELRSSLAEKHQALQDLLAVVDSRSQENANSLGTKSSELTDMVQRIEKLGKQHKQDVDELKKLEKAVESKLLTKEDVDSIALGVVQRISSDDERYADVRLWLDGRFAKQSATLCSSLPECKKELLELLSTEFEELVRREVKDLQPTPSAGDLSTKASDLSPKVVSELIQSSLDRHAADRIGRYDFALESQGGQVYIDGTSPSYDPGVSLQLMGFRLFSLSYSPRLAISADVLPGKCWPFEGSSGRVTLILSAAITVTHVSIDHTPPSLTPDGNRSSAPKDFKVLALAAQEDEEGVEVVSDSYDLASSPIQTFSASNSPNGVRFVRFVFTSNHGHTDYTCLYRIRVHGVLSAVSNPATEAEADSESQ